LSLGDKLAKAISVRPLKNDLPEAGIAARPKLSVVVGGISAIGAGLFSIGVPKDSLLNYEIALKTDRFLLLVHGRADEAGRAREIIKGTHFAELHTHPLKHSEEQEPDHAFASA
jgi:hypothetical protein